MGDSLGDEYKGYVFKLLVEMINKVFQ